MYPVLFSLGPLSISSFGFFLTIAFLFSIFTLWKLSKAYDINEGKILDLAILAFIGGIIGARIYFIIFNWEAFGSFSKVILLNRYPGLSFWGGLLGGIIALRFFTLKLKINYWQVLDFASVGFLIGLFFAGMGCFLGGCSYGIISELPIAAPVVGLIGKRFPISLAESLVFLIIFFYLWGQIIKFHFAGKIASLFLILLGLTKFISEFYHGDIRYIIPYTQISFGHLWSLLLSISGLVIFYRQGKRKIGSDIKEFFRFFSSGKKRKMILLQLRKNCYNFKIDWKIRVNELFVFLGSMPKRLKRRFNVKSTPKEFN